MSLFLSFLWSGELAQLQFVSLLFSPRPSQFSCPLLWPSTSSLDFWVWISCALVIFSSIGKVVAGLPDGDALLIGHADVAPIPVLIFRYSVNYVFAAFRSYPLGYLPFADSTIHYLVLPLAILCYLTHPWCVCYLGRPLRPVFVALSLFPLPLFVNGLPC